MISQYFKLYFKILQKYALKILRLKISQKTFFAKSQNLLPESNKFYAVKLASFNDWLIVCTKSLKHSHKLKKKNKKKKKKIKTKSTNLE